MAKLGEILVNNKVITESQLKQALENQKENKKLLGKILLDLGLINEGELLTALSSQLSIPYYPSLKQISIEKEAIKTVPAKFIWHYKFIPIKFKDNTLTIATSNPLDAQVLDDISLNLKCNVKPVWVPKKEIEDAIRKYYGVAADTVEGILEEEGERLKVKGKGERGIEEIAEVEDLEKSAQSASVIKLVDQLLKEAVLAGATDIHIEPSREKVKVRHRIDGILYDMPVPENIRFLRNAIISRIKVISDLNVVERRQPQDGRAKVRLGAQEIDLRISTLPTLYGEDIVIRILPTQMLFDLERLGFLPQDLEKIKGFVKKPHGIIFLTGPTGSGKTTTLYTCLSYINSPDRKIITVEDPVEYELPGITQIQVNPEVNLSFANALRSILRHDPDIMMIGEVRDLETADLAIKTALTGHLVFSTLHTNDAWTGPARLLDMGIEPYLIASSVEAFIAQRLVRKICPKCKQKSSEPMTDPRRKDSYFSKMITEEQRKMKMKGKIYRGKGCESCKFTGYKGRTAIYEFLVIEDSIKELILKKASANQIEEKARELGMSILRQQGWQKVAEGITTPEEVIRVTEME